MKVEVILSVVLVLLALAYEIEGLSCIECDRNMTCPSLGCPEVFHARRPCDCCPSCAADVGAPCSGHDMPCKPYLWCVNVEGDVVEARKSVPWYEPFQGNCGYAFTYP